MRIGTGYDSHSFDNTREMVLGGIVIPNHAGLTGHSDGDAIAHAVIDAVLGAAAAGDIGSHFPPSDDAWKNADSIELLRQATAVVAERDHHIVNVDVTVICETPRIGPYVEAMRERLATAMRVTNAQVSVKSKTNERMGWIGRGEGLAVHAVVMIGGRD